MVSSALPRPSNHVRSRTPSFQVSLHQGPVDPKRHASPASHLSRRQASPSSPYNKHVAFQKAHHLESSLSSFGITPASSPSSSNPQTPVSSQSFHFPPHAVAGPGRVVCPLRLQETSSKERNLSPFDARKYYALLPPPSDEHASRVTLALDIDETLVHAVAVPARTTTTGGRGEPLATTLHFSAEHAQSPLNRPTANTGTASTRRSAPSATPARVPPVHLAACAGSRGADAAGQMARFYANSDFVLHIGPDTGNEEMVFVQYRPFVHEFLEFAARHFEVVFFTASRSCYADPLLNSLLDHLPEVARPPPMRLYREHCAEVSGAKVKDLSLLGRPLSRVALVDNLKSSFMFQPRNGIHIKSWYGDAADTELRDLTHILGHLATAEDVVHVLDVYNSSLPVCQGVLPSRSPVSRSTRGSSSIHSIW